MTNSFDNINRTAHALIIVDWLHRTKSAISTRSVEDASTSQPIMPETWAPPPPSLVAPGIGGRGVLATVASVIGFMVWTSP